ncbi:hypothetical protein C5C34_14485 [Rathayibacter rathayi]|nr:hypothetical protein C5C34_14485 [Rathayibacter rathayi]PPG91629.1 hypothetical protein C5C22_13850 [Rathayibacter rathayi]
MSRRRRRGRRLSGRRPHHCDLRAYGRTGAGRPHRPYGREEVSARGGAGVRLIALGDSITRGRSSAPWLPLIDLPVGAAVINAGVDGDRIEDALRRLPGLPLRSATHIVVLLGTNDVLLRLRQGRRPPRADQLIHPEGAHGLRRDLSRLLAQLRRGSSSAIAVCALPPVGEHGRDDAAQVVREANSALRAACKEAGVPCLPLDVLLGDSRRRHAPAPGPGPSFGGRGMLLRTALRHSLLGWSFTRCAAAEGFVALCDGVHLSERGAQALASLVSEWVDGTREAGGAL